MGAKPKPTFVERPDAPIVSFDDALFFSVRGPLVSVTLTTALVRPRSGGEAEPLEAVVGYLRTDLQGAKALRSILDKAILAAAPAMQTKN